MISTRHVILTSLLAFLVLIAANAQTQKRESYTVRITVRDSLSKETIIGATMQMKSMGIYGVTDVNGLAVLQNIPKGQASIEISCLGYEPVVKNINVTDNLSLTVKLIETSLQLKEVSVVAKNSAAGASTSSTIGRQAIEHLQATNLGDLMQLLPGATMQTPDLTVANSLQLRTASNAGMDKTNSFGASIVVDGVPVSNNANINSKLDGNNDTGGKGVDLRQISADNIESVEVIRGIPSAEYGDLTSGAVIVKTKSGKTPYEVRTKVNPTTINTSLGKGFAFGKKGGFLNTNFDYVQAWGDPRKKTESFDRYSLSLNYSNTFYKKWRTNTKFSYSGLIDWTGQDPDAALEGLEDKQTNNNFRISHDGKIALNLPWMRTLSYVVGYSTQISESHKVAKIITNDFKPIISSLQTGYFEVPYKTSGYNGSGGVKSNPQDLFFKLSNNFGFKLLKSWTHQMGIGAEYRYEQNKALGYYNDDPLFPLKTNEDGRPRPYYDIPPVNQVSAYVEDKMTWKMFGMKTNLSAGIRYNMLQPGKEEQVSAFSPRLNASVELSKNIDLRLGYGQNAKTPGLTHLYPEKKYIDRIAANTAYQINPAERMVMYHTMVYDVQRSIGLKNAVNTKYEIGFDIKLPNERSLNIVAYSDVTPNGFGSRADYFSYLAEYYEIGKGLKYIPNQKPVLDPTTAPARIDTVYATKGMFGNTQWSRNMGIELDANLGRSTFLNTSFYFSAAYAESSSKTVGYSYSNPERESFTNWSNYFRDNQTPPFKFIYNEGKIVKYYSSLNSTLRAVTNIPALKMVMSNTIFVSWYDAMWTTNEINAPVGYMVANGNGGFDTYQITQEMLDNPEIRIMGHLLKDNVINNADKIPTRSIAPIWNISTRLTKEISKVAGFSFFVNNTLFYEPWLHSTTSTTLTQRNEGKFSFGMELYLKL